MLVFKFEKKGSAKFIAHLDMMRHMLRTFRRAEIDVKYSEGYNPHPLINLSPPIPLGVESECEYCYVNTEMKAKDLKKAYNQVAIEGLKLLNAENVTKNPNIAGISYAAEYLIAGIDLPIFEKIRSRLDCGEFEIEYRKKGQNVAENACEKILAFEREGSDVRCIFRFGNENLRADRFCESVAKQYGIDCETLHILKTAHFSCSGGKPVNIDKLL